METLLGFQGVNINREDNFGRTPLWFATSNGHVAKVRLLLEQENIDISCQNSDGKTALNLATDFLETRPTRDNMTAIVQLLERYPNLGNNSMVHIIDEGEDDAGEGSEDK
jgi:hypothetical protein